MTGRVSSINSSRGGVPKQSLFEGLITEAGLDGDRQRDRRFHGGPDRAIILFSMELIAALQLEGHAIAAGSLGENLTLSGLDWRAIVPGTTLQIGGARLRVTSFTSPCAKIAGDFVDRDHTRISQKHHPGWSRLSARVLAGGLVTMGDAVEVVREGEVATG